MWDSPFGIEWDEGGGAMKLDRTSMLYGTLLLTGTGMLSQALGFLYRICLSRLIGAEVMGLYQLVMPVYSVLLSVTAVGLTAAVSNLSAEYHARGDRGAVSALLRRCLALFLALFALAAAMVVPFSDPISVYLLGDARTRLGLVLLLPCVLLTGVKTSTSTTSTAPAASARRRRWSCASSSSGRGRCWGCWSSSSPRPRNGRWASSCWA